MRRRKDVYSSDWDTLFGEEITKMTSYPPLFYAPPSSSSSASSSESSV